MNEVFLLCPHSPPQFPRPLLVKCNEDNNKEANVQSQGGAPANGQNVACGGLGRWVPAEHVKTPFPCPLSPCNQNSHSGSEATLWNRLKPWQEGM